MLAVNSWAVSVGDAKSKGLIGESTKGYLVAVNAGNADIDTLIATINAKRKQQYVKIASKQGITLDQVELVAGEKLQGKAKPGHMILDANGVWQKK